MAGTKLTEFAALQERIAELEADLAVERKANETHVEMNLQYLRERDAAIAKAVEYACAWSMLRKRSATARWRLMSSDSSSSPSRLGG